MKIKTSVINDSLEEVRYFNNQRKKLFVLIFALIGAFIFGIISQKFHIIGKMLLNIQAQYNTVNERIRNAPVFSKLTQIDLQIGYVNFQKICYQRELALNMGRTYRVHSFNEGDVGAKIRAGDNFVPVKVSLKGGQPEHWADPQKWSFKIDVKSDTTIMGMKKFALQSPSARMFINDWVCHKLLRFAGLIGIRFDFIRFSLNGDDYGLYVIEENMGKELIEYNKRREGLILQFCQDINWSYSEEFSSSGIPDWFYGTIIQPYNIKKIMNDSVLKSQFEQALKLLEAYRNGEINGNKVFDVKLLARFFALIDLLGHKHAIALSNLKFYYNPLTGLLEPIGYDFGQIHDLYQDCSHWCKKGPLGMFQLLCDSSEVLCNNEQDWAARLFSDRNFYHHYIKEIEAVSDTGFLSAFFSETDSAFKLSLAYLQSQYPDYTCNIETVIRKNAEHLRELLNPVKSMSIWLNSFDKDNKQLCLEVVNFHPLPIVVDSVFFERTRLKCLSDTVVSCQINLHRPAKSVRLSFTVPDELHFSDTLVSKLKMVTHVFGTGNFCTEEVKPWKNSDGSDVISSVPVSLPDVIPEFLSVDQNRREIRIVPGIHTLAKQLEIPRGYEVYCESGTSIDLIDSAGITSFSPVHFVAKGNAGILIYSSDSSSKGVAVIDAVQESRFEGVTFKSLNTQNGGPRFLSGGVTIYNTRVIFERCEFLNMRSEDALNIMRSEVSILNTVFKNISSDAVDFDFCTGKISHCDFFNIANDACDFSGSTVKVEWLYVNKAGDKGISAGEKSVVSVENASICSTGIGVASKDLSVVTICRMNISYADTALAAYQKKPEFGGGKMTASFLEITNAGIDIYNDSQSTIKLIKNN